MGVASLILGIVSLLIGFIPFCGAIALLPAIIGLILGIIDVSVKSKKGEKKGQGIAGLVMSAIAIVTIIFWVFVVVAGSSNVVDSINEGFADAQTESIQSSDQQDYIEVDYIKLYEDYESNPIAADAKYKGKRLQVTGTVDTIDREIAGNTYITFEIGFLKDIRLTFKKAEESNVAQLSKGQTVTVRGTCRGTLLSTTVSLDNCELVK